MLSYLIIRVQNKQFSATPVDKKRPMSALERLWKTLEVSQRKEERAKQAPILSPCRLLVFPTCYYISNTTPLRVFAETDMPIDSLQRDVSTLTETTKRDISSLQFGHFSYFFHLYISDESLIHRCWQSWICIVPIGPSIEPFLLSLRYPPRH